MCWNSNGYVKCEKLHGPCWKWNGIPHCDSGPPGTQFPIMYDMTLSQCQDTCDHTAMCRAVNVYGMRDRADELSDGSLRSTECTLLFGRGYPFNNKSGYADMGKGCWVKDKCDGTGNNELLYELLSL